MRRGAIIALFGVAIVGVAGYWYWQNANGATGAGDDAKGRGSATLAVHATRAVVKPMPVVVEAVGTVEPEQSVTLRGQVSGILKSVLFKEGDVVKAGDLLFEIDPRTYQAQYNQALAALARDQAQLENATIQQQRLEPLLARDFITRQEYDVAVTSAKSLEATVESDRAAVEQARIQLEHSRIQAPISGRTGAVSVKTGNLVTASTGAGGTALVTINKLHPILVSFSVPERQLDAIQRHQRDPAMRVEILPTQAASAVTTGRLVFIDNAVSQQTGTVLLKTRVDNPGELLWPGEFVNVRIILTVEDDALVVPDVSVQPGQQGPFVYVVRDGRVAIQTVQVARQVGPEVVITSGLLPGDAVLTEVPQALKPGAGVHLIGDTDATSDRAAPDPPRSPSP
jgi:multidrug efflux system membrane fusion protein